MQTTIDLTKTSEATKNSNKKLNSDIWEKLVFSRYGIISKLVFITDCLGGVAASFGATGSSLNLSLFAFPTITSVSFISAVATTRAIIFLCSIALVLDLVVLIF